MNKDYYVVIMAGGIGSRFWPFSREKFPKQFHDVLGTGKSLLQQTAERYFNILPKENILVVTNKIYADLVKQQLPFMKDEQILSEPIARNTAPCVAYACYKIKQSNPNATMVVAPSDHVILKENEFESTIKIAMDAAAKSDKLITLGIKPSRPDTGYGYIQYIEENTDRIKKVKTFTEKPQLELAQKFLESGDFVWNAGIFIWNVNAIITNFQKHLPEMAEIFEEGSGKYWSKEEENFIGTAYSQCKNVSIDIGIMEKAEEVFVMLSDFGWSDLGTWKSLYELSNKDENSNVIEGNTMLYDVKNCIVKVPKEKLVVVEGLEDFIIAEFNDVLMICKKDHEQRVKDFVSDTKNKKDSKFI
jgi:mannose-1-phosphate guanylyltransferase